MGAAIPEVLLLSRPWLRLVSSLRLVVGAALVLALGSCGNVLTTVQEPLHAAEAEVTVDKLLGEMVDLVALSRTPRPGYLTAMDSSYNRDSETAGPGVAADDNWFANEDYSFYLRDEVNAGRKEHVLADLKGPGAVTRIWSANPHAPSHVRFYFDGEETARLDTRFEELFWGRRDPFWNEFSYIAATGGNFYFPLPYARSLKITIEADCPEEFYYEITHRTYDAGTTVETFDPKSITRFRSTEARVASALQHPVPVSAPASARWESATVDVEPGKTATLPVIEGEQAVFEWSARVIGTDDSLAWTDPRRPHNAYRYLILEAAFDGEKAIRVPLGDFFGSGPGVQPYEDLAFTVRPDGRMTSRFLMPFRRSMAMSLTNMGTAPYRVELRLHVGPHTFGDRGLTFHAQWGATSRYTRPFFDEPFLVTSGQGKVVGSVYEVANPVVFWWGEGDQKIFVDDDTFPSLFGTGTEDDYGYAYSSPELFARPLHAQTRADGPGNYGLVSNTRVQMLDAIPYRKRIRFYSEMWHPIHCRPTWTHVIFWYAEPGGAEPAPIDTALLRPIELGSSANVSVLEGEDLHFEASAGNAEVAGLPSGAKQILWRQKRPGDRLTVHFPIKVKGRYAVELNVSESPAHGKHRFAVDDQPATDPLDGYAPSLRWGQHKLGVFDLTAGDNTLVVTSLAPSTLAESDAFGVDYILVTRLDMPAKVGATAGGD